MRTFLLTVLLACSAWPAHAQTFLNLDFEYAGYRNQPRKWAIEGEGTFSAALDTAVAHHAHSALRLDLHHAQTYVFLALPASLIAGKQVEVGGYVRTTHRDSIHILLALKDPAAKPAVFPVMPKENGQWISTGAKASFLAAYSSDRLLVAVILSGSGTVWLDDFSIRIDGRDVGNGPPDFREPLPKEVALINRHALPLPGGSYTVRTHVLPGTATVVGLGENSHGSATVFQTKLSLARYLIQHHGFTVFALEAPAVEADSVNEYVVNGVGEPQRMLDHLVYPCWKTPEFAAFIDWLRTYNQTAKVKVQFRGIDLQDATAALRAIKTFCAGYDSAALVRVGLLDSLYQAAAGHAPWDAVLQASTQLKDYFHTRQPAANAVSQLHTMQRYALITWQAVRLKAGGPETRDAFLAAQVAWLYHAGRGAEKIIVSADNTHVTKASGKMGAYLQQQFHQKYISIATTFNEGTYSAYGPKEFYDVHPGYPGTYEYLLARCRYPAFLLHIQDPAVRPLFSSIAGFRSIGSRPQEVAQFADIRLADHFDWIIYLNTSDHTRPR